jgi:hypothetical protein
MNKGYFAAFIAAIMLICGPAISLADINNTSNAGASADSIQGQEQIQATDLNQLNNSFNTESRRGFVIPGDVNFGPLIPHYAKPLASEGYQPIEELLLYDCWFTEGSLKSMLKGVEKVESEFKVVNHVDNAKLAPEDGKTRWIKILISKMKYVGTGDVIFKGFSTTRSKHRETTMTEVMAKAALTALENGCNVIHFTAQGAVRDTEASGWGIGTNMTQAQVHDAQSRSNVTSVGMGYSSATGGTRDKPWLQGFGLIDNDLEYPELDASVIVTETEIIPRVDSEEGLRR